MYVRAVVNPNRDLLPDELVREGPVLDPLRDELLVRNQVFGSVPCDDRDVTRTEGIDPAEGVSDRDDVTGFDGPVQQENNAAHEIRYDLLETEADTESDRSSEYREGGEIDADALECQEEPRRVKRHADELAEQRTHARGERRRPVDPTFRQMRKQPRKIYEQRQRQSGFDQAESRNADRAEAHRHFVESVAERTEQTKDIEGGDRPDYYSDSARSGRISEETGCKTYDDPG